MGFKLPFIRAAAKEDTKTNAEKHSEGRFINIPFADELGLFSGDINSNDLVRACIHTNATHTSKAVARVFRLKDKEIEKNAATARLERLLNYTPNYFMTGRDFLFKSRALYEKNGVVYILIDRAPDGAPVGYYPIPTVGAALENSKNGKLIGYSFNLRNGGELRVPLADLLIIKKTQSDNDYYPDDNRPLLYSLGMLETADKSLKNAVNLSTKVRGILQSENSMLDIKDLKATRDQFIKDYLSLSDNSGIAALDGSSKFIPVSLSPSTANAAQVMIYENRVMRSFGLNDSILTNDYTDAQWIAYYQGCIEPFLIALSLEITNKSFTERERGHGNEIRYESNRLSYAGNNVKMQLVSLIDRGVFTLNEYREILNLEPVPGGDVRVIRKEYMSADDIDETEKNEEETDDGNES